MPVRNFWYEDNEGISLSVYRKFSIFEMDGFGDKGLN
jgi:hypothetical protein